MQRAKVFKCTQEDNLNPQIKVLVVYIPPWSNFLHLGSRAGTWKVTLSPSLLGCVWIFKWPDFCYWVGRDSIILSPGGFQMDFQVVPLTSRLLARQKAGQCSLELLQLYLFAVRKEQKQIKISGLWYRGTEEGLDTPADLFTCFVFNCPWIQFKRKIPFQIYC